MKIALIISANMWYCPYLKIYTDFLDKVAIEYDVISWNRTGIYEPCIQFNHKVISRNSILLLLEYIKYSIFVKKTITKNNYEKIILLSPKIGIFLCRFFLRNYHKKYIVDYRDLSIEQRKLFSIPFFKLIKNSYANFISSPGFVKFLPAGIQYNLSHNFDVKIVRDCLEKETVLSKRITSSGKINILTIGGIRDFSSNSELISEMSNKEDFFLQFVGKGSAADELAIFAKNINCKNISFEGYYPKEKEGNYIRNSSFLNIYYPTINTHDSALSNRFYNSLIYKVPMIVTKGGIQGEFVEKYGLGVAIENCEDLSFKLKSFYDNVSEKDYVNNCNMLLRSFLEDYKKFEQIMLLFIN